MKQLQTKEYQAMLDQCIHCGMCLEACPTFGVFGTEMDGPRGRIDLMRTAASGHVDQDNLNVIETHITRCLACRACETACPSNVKYGLLFEGARVALEETRQVSRSEQFLRWFGLRQLMPHRARVKLMARALWLYQVTGLQSLVRATKLTDHMPAPLKAMEEIMPPLLPRYRDHSKPAPAIGTRQGTVAFFMGCVQEGFLSAVNEATIRVLQRNGYEVHFPLAQTCCGAPHVHSGVEDQAHELARRNIDAFEQLNVKVDAIINNAGGCGLMLKEYPHLLQDDPVYAQRAKAFVAKVQDINEFLAENFHNPPTGRLNVRVTYAPSCHLHHGQGVMSQPEALLRQIPGVEVVPMQRPDQCCGSAGVYNITNADIANVVLDKKMADIASTGASVIVTSNTGCYMQYIYGARRAGLQAQVRHTVELLEQSYRAARS